MAASASADTRERLAADGYDMRPTDAPLGHGSYSTVKRAFDRRHGCAVAVKIIDKRHMRADYLQHFLPRELAIVRRLDHPHVVATKQVVEVGRHRVCIVEELAAHGDLLHRIQQERRLADAVARPLFRQLDEALRYLHERGIAHRDVKCENVLLDAYNNVKLADFGFCRTMRRDERSSTFCGSRAYAAPEILGAREYDGRLADTWSFGVVLYVALVGFMPYDEHHLRSMMAHQRDHRINYPRAVAGTVHDHAKKLIRDLLHPRAHLRPSHDQIVRSAWLRDTPWLIHGADGDALATRQRRQSTSAVPPPPPPPPPPPAAPIAEDERLARDRLTAAILREMNLPDN